MTEQEERTFTDRLEAALSWMKAVQERLRANDNTQGPRNALEARLRETEKIHQSEHDGRVKMEMALVAAERLLETGEEGVKSHIHAKLKELKSCWEETCTYIIHVHSRIEWVWLHWSEYLKALREFESWRAKQQCRLDVGVPLQVGLKEKLWQADQQRVALSDVHAQAALIKRLLDEAAVLHDRTRDSSVDSRAREGLQQAYDHLKDKVEDRLALLQGIAEEHRTYRGSVERFQSWLLSKTKELTDLMEKEDTSENKIQALKALDDMVASEEKALQHIEAAAEGVRVQTCPAGAELVVDEAEELRLGWQRLRQGLCEVEEGLRSALDTHDDYSERCRRLQDDVGSLRTRLRELERELEDPRGAEFSEEQMMDQWRRYTDAREALAAEESQVERLKSQLKELFGFSEDSRHISDDVLAVVREHQSVKCKAAKLCSESECGLRKTLEDTLLFFARWRDMVSQVVEASAEVTDLSHIVLLLQNIERLVKDSIQLQERLNQLQTRGDRLQSLFDPKRSDALRSELSSAARNRELLHDQLIQRKGRLEAFISSAKDFEEASVVIGSKLSSLRDAMTATVGLQPDILAKKSQSQQFRMDEVEFEYKRIEFEAWLCKENELLSGILNSKGATLKGNQLKIQQETLNALRSRVTWGQEHFRLLLQGSAMSKSGSGSAADASLEELRYRWMLYKSKLKAVVVPQARLGSKKITHKLGKPATGPTLYKKPGLLQRVCRLALPLWLLFLALLLLAFLLPLVDKGDSCSIANNFARSFSVMLRYSGPPPT
ncbi:nesprin-3 isoform X4 [Syngnathus typhle]|uniref:nesprin-3 isoform X4 n=1 Tax=Syngnathus typhle TaxID=161592 RepID=UPI002A69A590|nr:nesprin-3 isoform X4 [Syngnathus typhle]